MNLSFAYPLDSFVNHDFGPQEHLSFSLIPSRVHYIPKPYRLIQYSRYSFLSLGHTVNLRLAIQPSCRRFSLISACSLA